MSKLRDKSIVWKPTANETAKKLAGPVEVTVLKLTAGGGASHASFYDGTDASAAIDNNLVWVLDASTADTDSDNFNGLVFKKGIWAVCDQGIGFNPEICVAAINY